MAGDRCSSTCSAAPAEISPRFRRALWLALAVNATMFVIEFGAGWRAESISLFADAIDFLGDTANYGVSLWALGMAAVWRSRTALLKGITMGSYGLFVLGRSGWAALHGTVPDAATMGIVGSMALIANVGVAAVLYAWREGDANKRSVWLCSRNDAIGNVAVMLAALGVFGYGSAWPDLLVAVIMGALGMSAAQAVTRQALTELRGVPQISETPEKWGPSPIGSGPRSAEEQTRR